MTSKWKDQTGKGYDNHEVVGSEIRLGGFRLSIHHYLHCGDQWFVSCSYIFNQDPLDGQDISSLKKQAIDKFKAAIDEALNDIPAEFKEDTSK